MYHEPFILSLRIVLEIYAGWIATLTLFEKDIKTSVYLVLFLLVSTVIFLSGTFFTFTPEIQNNLSKLSTYLFISIFISAILVGSINPFFEFNVRADLKGIFFTIFLIIFFMSEIMSLSLFLKDFSFMREDKTGTYISFSGGLLTGFLSFFLTSRLKRLLYRFSGFLQVLFFLLIIKLIFGGTGGYSEITLIPSLQNALMKLFHDVVHQILVFFMVPDHPMLKTTVWNFIGILFGERFAFVATLLLIILPVVFLLESYLKKPYEIPVQLKGAERRRYIYNLMIDRRRRSVPFFVFIFIVLVLWFFKPGITAGLYVPSPRPVVEENGFITIKIETPVYNLHDRRLHKFSFTKDGDVIRILVIERPDGRFAVCLDACEICPPVGYGQREDHVVCIYCNTPIPLSTLGEPGGCNPIPLEVSTGEKEIRIEVSEIMKKMELVKSGVKE